MKLTLLFIFSLNLFTSVYTQELKIPASTKRNKIISFNSSVQFKQKSSGDTLYYYDFSDKNSWYFEDLSIPKLDIKAYKIDTVGPRGSFSIGMGKIKSTTSKNNFALIDSDAGYSSEGQQDIRLVLNETLNFSSTPNISISFQSYHKRFNDSIFIEFNVDETGWNTSIQIDNELEVNDLSFNPSYKLYNINSIVGGKSNVQLRFRYKGTWDYAWLIDDVAFIESHKNEIQITDFILRTPETFGFDYYSIPESQQDFPGLLFSAHATNLGITDETNVKLRLIDGNGSHFDSPSFSLNSGQTDSLFTTTSYQPLNNNYNYQLESVCNETTDDFPLNSTFNFDFNRGGLEYARHDGEIRSNFNYVDAAEMGLRAANEYYLYNNLWIQFVKGKFTVEKYNIGDQVYSDIEYFDSVNNKWILVSTQEATITNDALNDYVIFDFSKDQALLKFKKGQRLRIWIGHYPQEDPVIVASAQQTVPRSSFIQIGKEMAGYVLKAPMISILEYPKNTEIKENITINTLEIYPNPCTNELKINLLNPKEKIKTITCYDLRGNELVKKNTDESLHSTEMTLSILELAKGYYTLKIETTTGVIVKELIKN